MCCCPQLVPSSPRSQVQQQVLHGAGPLQPALRPVLPCGPSCKAASCSSPACGHQVCTLGCARCCSSLEPCPGACSVSTRALSWIREVPPLTPPRKTPGRIQEAREVCPVLLSGDQAGSHGEPATGHLAEAGA